MAVSIVCKLCKAFLSNANVIEAETGVCDRCEEEVNGWSE
jgi:hypothetical protein